MCAVFCGIHCGEGVGDPVGIDEDDVDVTVDDTGCVNTVDGLCMVLLTLVVLVGDTTGTDTVIEICGIEITTCRG